MKLPFPPVPGAPRDLLFLFTSHIANSQGGGYLKPCHPERSRGMTKGRVVAFIRSRQIGWTERNSRTRHCASLRAAWERYAPPIVSPLEIRQEVGDAVVEHRGEDAQSTDLLQARWTC